MPCGDCQPVARAFRPRISGRVFLCVGSAEEYHGGVCLGMLFLIFRPMVLAEALARQWLGGTGHGGLLGLAFCRR